MCMLCRGVRDVVEIHVCGFDGREIMFDGYRERMCKDSMSVHAEAYLRSVRITP